MQKIKYMLYTKQQKVTLPFSAGKSVNKIDKFAFINEVLITCELLFLSDLSVLLKVDKVSF